MIITDEKKLVDIQREFNEKFPFLKLEFYTQPYEAGVGSPNKVLLPALSKIGEVRQVHNTGDLGINGHLKVKSLEQLFQEQYGLNVQVFRRSGELWLQTTSTDDWTLSEQNQKGQRVSKSADEWVQQ